MELISRQDQFSCNTRAFRLYDAPPAPSPTVDPGLVETYLADRPYDEVAAELGIPVSTLRSRVFYGLKALRVVLEEMEVIS